jgi:two-component system, NarL family, sensor kinase
MNSSCWLKYFCTALILILFFITTGARAQHVDSIRSSVNSIIKSRETRSNKSNINPDLFRADTIRINQYLTGALRYQTVNYDSLLFFTQRALDLSLKLADAGYISKSVQFLGRYYIMKEDYRNAGECFLLSLQIAEKQNNKKRIADLNDELGTVYYYQEIFDKSLNYFMTSLEIYEEAHDTLNMAVVYSHIGSLHSSHEFCQPRTKIQKREDFNIALGYHEKSVQLCIKLGNKPLMINGYVNLASVYNKLDQPEKALPYLNQALDYYRTANNLNKITGTLHTLGRTYFKLKQYERSTQYFLEALKISRENNYFDGIQYLYESMAQTFEASKDYKNAYDYYLKYMTVRDSIKSIEKSKELFELETKYQTEKKEKEILLLTAQKREKNFLLFALSGLILILSVLGYSVIKNFRNKKVIAEQTIKIKEQRIQDLEKERQLIATKSVLKGEESERSRMARDLHDGLGGMLSGVKINLSSMKGNSIISSENAEAFDHAIRLLDTSISELRRVAHNLMPETLNHYGLKTALHDFVGEMRTNIATELSFAFFGDDIRFESQLELTAYRIAQELVNNALKHSEATRIDLQLIAEADRICIQVVDNGKGFDTSGKAGGGKGLISIHDRVAANKGRFEIESTPGQGTEATVEFLLS